MEQVPVGLEVVVAVSDEGVPPQKMLVGAPLVEDVVSLLWRANRIQHIGIGLGVDGLLEGLDVQAQVHLVGGDVLRDIGQIGRLDGVKEDQEGKNLVVGGSLLHRQFRIILGVLGKVDFLWNPEVVHGLPIPAGDPLVFHIVEVVQVGCVATNHSSQPQINVTIWIEQRSFNHFFLHKKTIP